jgi:hypothetical protein
MTPLTRSHGIVEPMESRTLLSSATGAAPQLVRFAAASAVYAPTQSSLAKPAGSAMAHAARTSLSDASVQGSGSTVDRSPHSDDGTFSPHRSGEVGHDVETTANGAVRSFQESIVSRHTDGQSDPDAPQSAYASAPESVGVVIAEFVVMTFRDPSPAHTPSTTPQPSVTASAPATAARAAVADVANSTASSTTRTALAVVANQLASTTATVIAHATTPVLDVPAISSTHSAARSLATSLVRRAVAAVSPFSAVALDDVASPATADPAALATTAGAVARSFASAVPAVQQTMGEALAFMLATPRAFHIERMGSPLTLLADSVAAFAEESASIPLASMAGGALYATPAADASSKFTRAWTITAAVVAADAAVFSYLYHRSNAGRRSRRRA